MVNFVYYNDQLSVELPSDVQQTHPYVVLTKFKQEYNDLLCFTLSNKPLRVYPLDVEYATPMISVLQTTEETEVVTYMTTNFLEGFITFSSDIIESGETCSLWASELTSDELSSNYVYANYDLLVVDSTEVYMKTGLIREDGAYSITEGTLKYWANIVRYQCEEPENLKLKPEMMLLLTAGFNNYGFLEKITSIQTMNQEEFDVIEETDDSILYAITDVNGQIVKLNWEDEYIWDITSEEE